MHQVSIPDFARERGALMRPVLSVNAAQTAVIAIDFQRFFIDAGQPMGNQHARDILDHANRLHAAVRQAGGLVIFTQHSVGPPPGTMSAASVPAAQPSSPYELLPGSDAYDLHPDIVRAAADWCVVKYQSSALHPGAATGLHEHLRARGIDTLIITGLVTNGCCDCTARDAFQYGYTVVVATDATAAMTDAEHNAALLNLAIYYAHTLDSAAIAAAL